MEILQDEEIRGLILFIAFLALAAISYNWEKMR